MAVSKNCKLCSEIFWSKPSQASWRKYCSRNCHNKARETFEVKKCIICDLEFKYYKSSKNSTGKFCSLKCKGIYFKRPDLIKICLLCKKNFKAPMKYKIKKYCSNECYAKTMAGKEKPSFWETASYEKQIERLKKSYNKYVIRNEIGCWGWTGCLAKKYGSLQFGGKYKSISAHRASWLIHYGPISEGMFVCHTCDNPACTRPDHLFLGTPTDNVQDMIKKGRRVIPHGEKSSTAKLKEIQVIEIKKLLKENISLTDIANKFNINWTTIYDIKKNKTWKHLRDNDGN